MMLAFLAHWLGLVPRSELEVQESQAATLIRDLGRIQEVQATEITRLRHQIAALTGLRERLTRIPADAEELRWQTIVGYGFTPQAAAYLYRVRFRYGMDAEIGRNDGLGNSDGDGSIVLRQGAGRPVALHELLHVCWPRVSGMTRHDSGVWHGPTKEPEIETALLRLVNGEGATEAVTLARAAWVGGVEEPWLRVQHPWVRLGVSLKGKLGLLPPYMQPYYAEVFTAY